MTSVAFESAVAHAGSEPREAWARFYSRTPHPWRAGDPDVLSPLQLPPGAKVLDGGAGGGNSQGRFAGRGWRIVPYDFVPGALPPGGIVADARALPFRSGSFDGVLLRHVLEHLAPGQDAAAVREAVRVLRPGGRLLAVVFAEDDVRAAAGRGVAPGTRERGGIRTHYYSAAEIRRLFPAPWNIERVTRRTRWGLRSRFRALGP
jgi:SAM-dependent methyltransferase